MRRYIIARSDSLISCPADGHPIPRAGVGIYVSRKMCMYARVVVWEGRLDHCNSNLDVAWLPKNHHLYSGFQFFRFIENVMDGSDLEVEVDCGTGLIK